MLLQLKSQSVKVKKKPYIRVNTRELDRVSSTKYLCYIYDEYTICDWHDSCDITL